MVARDELEKENQDIIDRASILAALVDKSEFRKNPVFCELLHDFMEKINLHLNHEARSVYSELLTHSDVNINNAATQFMSNAHELEKILHGYTKRWCVAIPPSGKHDTFVEETNEIFRLLNERIAMESNLLFQYIGKEHQH